LGRGEVNRQDSGVKRCRGRLEKLVPIVRQGVSVRGDVRGQRCLLGR